jgi:hypothetical protein
MNTKQVSSRPDMVRQQVLDLYFLDSRHKLIDIAAFLDRVERAGCKADFRLQAFRSALHELLDDEPAKVKRVLMRFSDPTTDPIPAATTKGGCGAWEVVEGNVAPRTQR